MLGLSRFFRGFARSVLCLGLLVPLKAPTRNSPDKVRDTIWLQFFLRLFQEKNPEGPTIKKLWSRSKFAISIEIFDLTRKFQSRRLDFPTKNRAAVGGSLENFILARNFQSRSKSRDFFDLWALWETSPLRFGWRQGLSRRKIYVFFCQRSPAFCAQNLGKNRLISSAKFKNRLKIGQNSTQIRPKID